MHITGLRYFLAVARLGSVAEASEQLHVAASAISRQISNLEASLNCILFERRPRGMALSPAGERLAEYARRMLLESEQIALEINELRGLSKGFLRLSTSEGFSLDLLPRAVASFRERYPGIRFDISVQPPASVTRQVREGEVDIGLTLSVAPEANVNVVHRAKIEMLAICAPNHPIAHLGSITLAEMRNYEIALPASNTTARKAFDAACSLEGVSIEPVLTANAIATLLPFVLNSRAISVLSAFSQQSALESGALAAVPISTKSSLARTIEIQTMKGRKLPEVADRFIEHLLDAMGHTSL